MTVEIRTFNSRMIDDVVAVYNRLTERTPYCYPIDREVFEEAVTSKKEFDPEGFLVAYLDGRPRGVIHAFMSETGGAKRGSIMLFLAEERQVCRALVAAAVDFVKRRGAKDCHVMGNAPGTHYFYGGVHTGYETCLWRAYSRSCNALERAGFELEFVGFPMSLKLEREPEIVIPDLEVEVRVRREEDCGSFYTQGVVEAFACDKKIGACGFYFLKRLSKHMGYGIGQIGIEVDERFRRKHIASSILSRAHHELWKIGAKKVMLGTNYELFPALQLYEKMGYHKELADFHTYTAYFDE